MSSDLERRDRRRDGDREFLPILKGRRSCLGGVIAGVLLILGSICGGFLGLLPGCNNYFSPKPLLEAQTMESEPLPAMGAVGGSGMTPYNEHTKDATGNIVSSYSNGPGFVIKWRGLEPSSLNGATIEQVLDATLSRMEALNRSPQGGGDLTKHVFALDKLLNEIRQGGFSEAASFRGEATGPGFAPPPDAGKVGGVGSGDPGTSPSDQ